MELIAIAAVPVVCALVVAAAGFDWMARSDVLRRRWGSAITPVRARDVVGAVVVVALFTAVASLAYVYGIARPALFPLVLSVVIGGLLGLSPFHAADLNTIEPRIFERRLVRAIARRTGSSFRAYVAVAALLALILSAEAAGPGWFSGPVRGFSLIVLMISCAVVAGVVTAIVQRLRFGLSRAGRATASDSNP